VIDHVKGRTEAAVLRRDFSFFVVGYRRRFDVVLERLNEY
jgi:hypothetical protein